MLHINKAACNLELSMCSCFRLGGILNGYIENYGKVLWDCSAAITINVKSPKAYYRSALALVALERYDEAVDSCSRCLGFDPTNQPVVSLKGKAEKLRDEKVKKEEEKQERLRMAEERRRRLQVAFKVRGSFDPRFCTPHVGGRRGTSSLYPIPRGRQTWITNLTSMERILTKVPSSSRSTSCTPNMRPWIQSLTLMRTHPSAST